MPRCQAKRRQVPRLDKGAASPAPTHPDELAVFGDSTRIQARNIARFRRGVAMLAAHEGEPGKILNQTVSAAQRGELVDVTLPQFEFRHPGHHRSGQAVVGDLTGRQERRGVEGQQAGLDGINSAARAVAAGSSASVPTGQVTSQLTQLLALRSCSFQYGVAGIGRPARLHHDGSVTLGHQALDVGAEGFPAGTDIELLVESGGIFQGRFLMTRAPGERPTLEQRLMAVALADQVGAALATSHPVDQS
jgi:hypothetical protein